MTVDQFLARLHDTGLTVGVPNDVALAPATCIAIAPECWHEAARLAKEGGFRFSAFWAREADDAEFEALTCLEHEGRYVVLRTTFGREQLLPSQASVFPSADRPERHARDLLGVHFGGAPDGRRWTRHLAWSGDEFPLQASFHARPGRGPTPPDDRYPFIAAHGAGIVEIPVGPVHAGIIEPGHFRFQAIGETVLNLEQHLGYVHKGIEKIAVGRDLAGLARLAGRVSGDSTVAHAWAACQAIERAVGVDIPDRACWLRAIMCERERVANHMGDIGAICNDVGYAFPQAQLTRLKEAFVRQNRMIFGHRFMMDRVVPGGVDCDVTRDDLVDMREHARRLAKEFASLIDRIEASESLEDRLMTTGRLTPDQARELGTPGYVGKASGQGFDVRQAMRYRPYDEFAVTVPVYRAGDVAARAKVRADEVIYTLGLIAELADSMPEGPIRSDLDARAGAEGLGTIEGWRGEIVTYVRLDRNGRVERFYPRDPSWLTWPALELLIQDNIVPDFPVCNKSINGSYSGGDL